MSNHDIELPVHSTPTYDRHGRMTYHPDYHAKQGHPWTTSDQTFLIENYEKIGPEETSFALERTIHAVMMKACYLRKQGVMAKPEKRKWFKRLKNETNHPTHSQQ